MSSRAAVPLLITIAVAVCASPSGAQSPPDASTLLAAQRKALEPLAYMDGVWRGSAWVILSDGERRDLTQTERIGSFLDGTVKVIEGRGYDDSARVAFNAFGIVSFDPARQAYSLRSYAMGRAGDFVLTRSDSGFVWEIPAGPSTIRYTATVRAGKWREVGERLVAGQQPLKFFEMNLVRLGDSDWPAAGAIRP